MLLLIDNYDSFTHNLAHLVARVWEEPKVSRVDETPTALSSSVEAVIFSPGPGRPDDEPHLGKLLQAWLGLVPIFGVCLGYQALGLEFGARLLAAPKAVHGHSTPLVHKGRGLFRGCPEDMQVARYHSLCLDWSHSALPEGLEVDAHTEDGLPMSLSFPRRGAWGVQFHPESFLSEAGEVVIKNFREEALAWRVPNKTEAL
jgi:anthranilate synthase/aminodeoxychorismate synthase-like glutamine amidotransferase